MDFAPAGVAARAFKRQLQQADKSGAHWVFIRGEDEIAANEVTIKNMTDSSQSKLSVDKLMGFLQEIAGKSV
jgi:histidyl-tRNA synthetase